MEQREDRKRMTLREAILSLEFSVAYILDSRHRAAVQVLKEALPDARERELDVLEAIRAAELLHKFAYAFASTAAARRAHNRNLEILIAFIRGEAYAAWQRGGNDPEIAQSRVAQERETPGGATASGGRVLVPEAGLEDAGGLDA